MDVNKVVDYQGSHVMANACVFMLMERWVMTSVLGGVRGSCWCMERSITILFSIH